ncbi:MAG: HD domain-containing protein [Candidatus Wallbacteria bacterium]
MINITDAISYTECFMQLAKVLDLDENRDDYHSWRVAVVAYMMVKKLNSPDSLKIFWTGLLHDIGAYGFNDFMISTSDSLSVLEKAKIKHHTIRSYDIIKNELPGEVHDIADFAKHHHEKYDGTGFPDGLSGNEIPLCSQIIKIADDFDKALRAIPRLPKATIYNLIRQNINTEYSREMVELFLETMENDDFFNKIELEAQIPQITNQILSEMPNYKMYLENDLLEKITEMFALIIDAKHEETLGHSGRVAFYCTRIAEYLNLHPKDKLKVKMAGFMHDIGKAAIPRTILNKSSNLTTFEMHMVKGHPVLTMEILKNMKAFRDIVEIAGYHHERLNGSGYPYGLPAEDIPFLARIVMVADVYDAMTSGRRYQAFISKQQALDYLNVQKKILFDADTVNALTEVAKNEELKNLDQNY